MIKAYCSMARRFHPDNNYGFHTTEMITMINTAKDGLQDQLRENDWRREEEHVQAAEDESSIQSDHNPDSESSGTSSEPASSHPWPWTSKKTKTKIKNLHIRCDGIDTIEHLYILPSRWVYLLKTNLNNLSYRQLSMPTRIVQASTLTVFCQVKQPSEEEDTSAWQSLIVAVTRFCLLRRQPWIYFQVTYQVIQLRHGFSYDRSML